MPSFDWWYAVSYLLLYNLIIVTILDNICYYVNCMGKMMFVVNLVNNKVGDNLLILLVSNFHGNGINGLIVIAVGI